jgi:hypothetical protein
MPARDDHLKAAIRNEAIANRLLMDPESGSWAIVLAFYGALHWADAYLAGSAIHPRSHSERERSIRGSLLRDIYDQYRTLSDRSREVRYDLITLPETEVRLLIDRELREVKEHSLHLL